MEKPCDQHNEEKCVNYPPYDVSFDTEPYSGSFQRLLNENIGKFVSIDFMVSSCEMRTLSGIIENVTGRYVSLHNPKNNCRNIGDAWGIKVVTFPCCDN